MQLHYAGADVSFSSLFDPRVRVARGPVTVRELAALYLYDNELYAIEGNGRMVREALENAARYYRTCPEPSCSRGPLVDRGITGYNYDMAQGVEYEIDLTRPEGQRVRNLRYRGAPLRDDEPLRIALNNYRAAGSAGYTMFRGAKVVWRSGREIRDLMVEYFGTRRRLPVRPDGNWRLSRPRALETLALEEAAPALNRADAPRAGLLSTASSSAAKTPCRRSVSAARSSRRASPSRRRACPAVSARARPRGGPASAARTPSVSPGPARRAAAPSLSTVASPPART